MAPSRPCSRLRPSCPSLWVWRHRQLSAGTLCRNCPLLKEWPLAGSPRTLPGTSTASEGSVLAHAGPVPSPSAPTGPQPSASCSASKLDTDALGQEENVFKNSLKTAPTFSFENTSHYDARSALPHRQEKALRAMHQLALSSSPESPPGGVCPRPADISTTRSAPCVCPGTGCAKRAGFHVTDSAAGPGSPQMRRY